MSYASGQITSSADARLDLIAEITDELDAHAAWELVEAVVVSTVTWEVYKCLGTENAFGTDFFIGIGYLTASNNNVIYFWCAEGYDSADNTVIRPCVGNGNPHAVASDGSLGNGTEYALAVTQTNHGVILVSTNNTSTAWHLSVTDERVILATFTNLDDGVYLGLFESFVTADPFPLLMASQVASTNSSTGDYTGTQHMWSRHPGRESQASNSEHFKGSGLLVGINSSGTPPSWTVLSGEVNTFYDGFHDKALFGRICVCQVGGMVAPFSVSTKTYGGLRGLLYDCYVSAIDSAVALGDTVTIGGLGYVCIGKQTVGSFVGAMWVRSA